MIGDWNMQSLFSASNVDLISSIVLLLPNVALTLGTGYLATRKGMAFRHVLWTFALMFFATLSFSILSIVDHVTPHPLVEAWAKAIVAAIRMGTAMLFIVEVPGMGRFLVRRRQELLFERKLEGEEFEDTQTLQKGADFIIANLKDRIEKQDEYYHNHLGQAS
jgi:hypothetical protein